MGLPTDAKARKALPVVNGFIDYFPRATAAVADVSRIGNDQHNPGQPLHWSFDKSYDHPNCIGRHLIERGTIDTDGARHSAKLAWRAMANLEVELMAEEGDPRAIKIVNEIGTAAQKARLADVLKGSHHDLGPKKSS